MNYFLALLACVAEFIAYAVVGAILDWKHGGGVIPMLILFSVITWTWHTITKSKSTRIAAPSGESAESAPEAKK